VVAQAVVSTCEMYFVGWLGPEALAGVSLVFPLIMLMQTMSAGGMGGGVASAVARALGAGRRQDADALALHALVIAGVMAALFTTGMLWGGPTLYHLMGGRGDTLAAALLYSQVVFSGALSFWLLNTLASIVRGQAICCCRWRGHGRGRRSHTLPALILGWGPVPRLGIAGANLALIIYYSVSNLVLWLSPSLDAVWCD
jgi:Na+-driven multidrug efflux pump